MRCFCSAAALMCCLFAVASKYAFSQETLFFMRIENQRVVDGTLEFDITVENTGETDIWVGETDLVLEYNNMAFDPGSLEIESELLTEYYTIDVLNTPEHGFLVSIISPLFSGESQFQERISKIASGSGRVVLATGKVSSIVDTLAVSGLNWDMESAFPQSMYSYNPDTFQQSDITTFAFYRPAPDFHLSTPTSIQDTTVEPRLVVYPNPVSDFLYIEGGQVPLSVSLSDVRGNESPLRFLSTRKIDITPDIAVGPYVLRVTYPDRVVAFRIQIKR